MSDGLPQADGQNKLAWDTGNIPFTDRGFKSDGESSNGTPEMRQALINGQRISVCFGRVSAGDLARELSSMTGVNIKVEPKDAGTIINYSAKGLALDAILAQMSEASGVRFVIDH
jgi:hypothetical protein